MQSIVFIFPELFLSLAIMILLMFGVFVKKSFKLVYLLTILSLIFTIILIFNLPEGTTKIFNESYIIDKFSIFMKILTLSFCLLILLSSKEYIKESKRRSRYRSTSKRTTKTGCSCSGSTTCTGFKSRA